MGRRKDAFVQSSGQWTLTLIGDSNPAGVIHSPRPGCLFWDQVANDLYISEATGKNDWVLASTGAPPGPGVSFTMDSFDVTINGQTSFTLSNTPSDDTKVVMYINGHRMLNGTHFTVSSTAVTFVPGAAGFQLELLNEFGVPDRVEFEYFI